MSDALDAAQADAVAEIRRFLALHSVTRVGPRGRQEVVSVERLQTVAVVHKTSRAGDPHRHVHFQVGARVWAAGRWRGLDTAALFKQQGAVRALGTAVLAAHPVLAETLDRHGLTLDPVTGEVAELEPFNTLMSKRAAQVEKNLATAEAAWEESHPGQEPGPVVHARMVAAAWAKDRPQKRPTTLAHEDGWRRELADAGYDPDRLSQRRPSTNPPLSLDEVEIQTIASRALDRCAAAASTWTRHTVQENVTRILTEYGVRTNPAELRELIELATDLAVGDCLSVLPPGTVRPEHVAHLTSLQVIASETKLRDLLTTASTGASEPDVTNLAEARGLDDAQIQAAAAIASTDPLVIVEGAAGAGKTTMLGAAIAVAASEGRATRIVTPTKKAADVAVRELGVPAESVARLLHAHGWRWNDDGVWTRVDVSDLPSWAYLERGERIVVDEAGMLDQDSAIALLTLAAEAGATVALVGDRAQLPAVGRGGVLDIAAEITTGAGGTVHDLDTVHRFTDPAYAELTVQMRAGHDPAAIFDRLHDLGLIQLHDSDESAQEQIATATTTETASARTVAATVATNDETRSLNERIRDRRVASGDVDDTVTTTGRDGLPIGVGDVIATRKNDSHLGVANRQMWTVQHVGADGSVSVVAAAESRTHQRTVTLPSSYVAEHVHLAYAATGYGLQGTTTTTSHTLLSDSLDAAGVYVGMTRGRDQNLLHIVAENLDDAREQLVNALERDRADRGLQAATTGARGAVIGLTAHGPVKIVNDERQRLTQLIEHAEREAARWEHAATVLAEQAQSHAREEAAASDAAAQATAKWEAARNKALEPLLLQASADGSAYLETDAREHKAWQAVRSSGRLGRRAAERKLAAATAETHTASKVVVDRWGSLPDPSRSTDSADNELDTWAVRVASQRAESEPTVAQAKHRAEQADDALKQTRWRHRAEAEELAVQVYGRRDAASYRLISGPNAADSRARRWHEQAVGLRRYLDRIESLPVGRAVHLIEMRQADVQRRRAQEQAQARRAAPPITTPPLGNVQDNGLGLGL